MTKLIPEGELAFNDWQSCIDVADILVDQGYVVMLSREEDLYIINYVWTSKNADRNDVVFMEREDFEQRFCEDEDYVEEDDWSRAERIKQVSRANAETEVWHYAKRLMTASNSTIEAVFGLDQLSEEAQDRFWGMFPDQLSYAEVKNKFEAYDEQRNAALGERIMDACLADLDRVNKEKYDRIMRAGECDTTTYATALNDTLPSA